MLNAQVRVPITGYRVIQPLEMLQVLSVRLKVEGRIATKVEFYKKQTVILLLILAWESRTTVPRTFGKEATANSQILAGPITLISWDSMTDRALTIVDLIKTLLPVGEGVMPMELVGALQATVS